MSRITKKENLNDLLKMILNNQNERSSELGKDELIQKVESGQVRLVPNWQLWVFVISVIFAVGGTYANFNSRINSAEINIEDLKAKETIRAVKEIDIKITRDKQWHEIQMNMKNICKALKIPYEKID